ncbi:MAG: threonine ammonia-lyase [Desulfurococcales archaeon]|nr:threonine ammonia-lyase [Desulfurococcales archaeon]
MQVTDYDIVEVVWMRDFTPFLDLIREARNVLEGNVHRTPLTYSTYFSNITGKEVYLKLENLQKTGSFKVRGAYFKISSLLPDVRDKGVVAASSGNHAQGVAYSAMKLGVKATIVMPKSAPPYKVNATKSYGAEVILEGDVYDDAYAAAMRKSKESGAYFIHPFDDPYVIAGQGTIGVEIAEDLPDVDTVLVPVGGGGLISGISLGVKPSLRGRSVKIIGVEPEVDPKLKMSFRVGRPVTVKPMHSLADGVVTKSLGRLTFEVIRDLVDDALTVGEDDIARAMYLLLERAKLLAEGAGALPLAALLKYHDVIPGRKVVAVISGGNADLTTLYKVIMRGLAIEGRLARVNIKLKDEPGALKRALEVVARKGCNIVDIRHDRMNPSVKPGIALVELLIESPSPETTDELLKELELVGVKVIRHV